MPKQVSAVESISPAFARTKKMLFHPFRFGLWARLAVVSLVTGEVGGGGGGSSFWNFNSGQGGGQRWSAVARLFSESGWEQTQPYIGWLALCVGLALALLLLWIYSDCVYRFILLDSVLTGQCRLREGWRRWREAGRRYLLWVIAFGFSALGLIGIVVGVPLLLAFRAGWFEKSEDHFGALLGGGMLLALVVIVLIVVLATIDLLARDFLVPVMALESVGAMDGWRRLGAMLGEEKLAYAGYVLDEDCARRRGRNYFYDYQHHRDFGAVDPARCAGHRGILRWQGRRVYVGCFSGSIDCWRSRCWRLPEFCT